MKFKGLNYKVFMMSYNLLFANWHMTRLIIIISDSSAIIVRPCLGPPSSK